MGAHEQQEPESAALEKDAAETDDAEKESPEAAAARKRKMAQVFGEVLPEVTRDERGDSWGEGRDRGDDWYRSQVPPHHG